MAWRRSSAVTGWCEMTQSPDGNRAIGRRPRSMTSSRTSGCRANPRHILAGTASRNASSSPPPPVAAGSSSTPRAGAGAPRHGRSPRDGRLLRGSPAPWRGAADAERGRVERPEHGAPARRAACQVPGRELTSLLEGAGMARAIEYT
jgi:hypothetical protein